MDEQREVKEVKQTTGVVDGADVRRESVATSRSVSGAVIAKRIIWFIAGFIIILLAIRVVFLLLGANQDSAFVNFVYALSAPFAAPFYGIFAYQPTYGVSTLEISSLVAMAMYALIAWGITQLITLTKPRTEA